MEDKAMENPLRKEGSQFRWEFMNPSVSSRGTKDGYKYFLKVEIQKDFHEMLVDAELAGMVVANVGVVIGTNEGFIKETKPKKSPQAIKYHEDNKKWPSNTADALCKEYNFFLYLEGTHPELKITPDYDDLNSALKLICDEISSKSELDTNHEALTTFTGMLHDYRKFVQENNK